MYLVLIAWLYVTLLMAVAEATSPTGSLLGAIVTFTLYGLLPMGSSPYSVKVTMAPSNEPVGLVASATAMSRVT